MNNMFGDNFFSNLLHTPFSQLQDMQPTMQQQEESFTVYDFSAPSIRQAEVLTLDSRIDDESRIIFNTYEAILKQVFTHDMDSPNITSLQVAKSTYDFSLLIAQLSRIWELELNNSVVQIVRLINGIEMPQYYQRVKTDRNQKAEDVIVKVGDISINLNDWVEDKRLKPQMMGHICILLQMFRNPISDYLGVSVENFKSFIKKIEIIKQYRNKASHTSVLEEDDFHVFYETFCFLLREKWLTILMHGKDRVRAI